MIRLLAILICAVFTFSTAYAQDAKKKKETVTFFVEGMDCANCVKKIEKNIAFEKGVPRRFRPWRKDSFSISG